MQKKINTTRTPSQKTPPKKNNNSILNSKAGESLKKFLNSFKQIQEQLKIKNFDFLNKDSGFEKILLELCNYINEGGKVDENAIITVLDYLKEQLINLSKDREGQSGFHKLYARKLFDFFISIQKEIKNMMSNEKGRCASVSQMFSILININQHITVAGGHFLLTKNVISEDKNEIVERIEICKKMLLASQSNFELAYKQSFIDFLTATSSPLLLPKLLEQYVILMDIEMICSQMASLKNEYISLLKFYLKTSDQESFVKSRNILNQYVNKKAEEFKKVLLQENLIVEACKKTKENSSDVLMSINGIFDLINKIKSPIENSLMINNSSSILRKLEELSDNAENELGGVGSHSIVASKALFECFNSSVVELREHFIVCQFLNTNLEKEAKLLARAAVFYVCYSFSTGDLYGIPYFWKNISEFIGQLGKDKINKYLSEEYVCLDNLISALKEFMQSEITNVKVEQWLNRTWQSTHLLSILPLVALPEMLWIERNQIFEKDIDDLIVTLVNYLENHWQKLIISDVYREAVVCNLKDLLLFFAKKKSVEKQKNIAGLNELIVLNNKVKKIFNLQNSIVQKEINNLSEKERRCEFDDLVKELLSDEKKQREQERWKKIHDPKDWRLSPEMIEISKNDIVSNNEKKQPRSIDVIMYEDIENKKRDYDFFINSANQNNDKESLKKNSEHICEDIIKSIEQERSVIHNQKTPIGKFKVQLLAFYEISVKLNYYKFKNNRLLLDLVRGINDSIECESKEKDSNIKQQVLLKNDIKDIQEQTTAMRRAICNSQDVLERLAEKHCFLKENNINILSPELDKLLEKQIEFQEYIPSDQLIDAIAILTSKTTLKIHEQMEILEVAQYNLKHACYFTENFKEYLLPLIEEKIKQLTVTFSESFKDENRPNTTDIFSMGIRNSSLPNEIENNSSQNQDISQNNMVISETIDSETSKSDQALSLFKENLNRIKENQKEKQPPKKIRIRDNKTKEIRDIPLVQTQDMEVKTSVKEKSESQGQAITNKPSPINEQQGTAKSISVVELWNSKQSDNNIRPAFFNNNCLLDEFESIIDIQEFFYKDKHRDKDVPTHVKMRSYLKTLSRIIIKNSLKIEGVAPETFKLHCLILKLFVSFYTDYKIFSQTAAQLKSDFLGGKMDEHFSALSEVVLDRMADLLDYALVCKKLNSFVSVNSLCKEIEKNKNIHSNNTAYYYTLLSYFDGVSAGLKLAYDPLEWLENRFGFIAVNLNSIFNHWHLLPRLEQVHLLHSAFVTLFDAFSVLLERTEVFNVTEQNSQPYDRVWNLNEKAQSLYFYLQTLLGISDFRNVDGEENKKLTEHVYLQKFQLQTRLVNYHNPKQDIFLENKTHDNECSTYTI